MTAWGEFTAAFLVFFLSHALPVRPPLRPRLETVLGRRGFTIAYSALSLAVLAWLIGAAGRAPFVPLWNWAPWQAHVPLVVMALVCVIVALAIGRPNPFSFGGSNNAAFDPQRAGLVRLSRHPLLLALALWSLAHLVPNGDLAHVILFGCFAGFAVLGMRIIDRRKQRVMGAEWQRMRTALAAGPLPPRPHNLPGTLLRTGLGGLLYLLLLGLHPVLFGVSPLP
ncbi:NnrU family protein [Thalassococcus sp. CAU 1522]|uniref:NnrU family protein n=1 Tax=Thalassococcus arenae TaxID=2851652 RepID=A0ABS6NC82_9RHOB|nr:NnrU family protein [Thalassococcus arenae]MBV2361631.1 NnrU family protein [Thalassococcus arenae]